jgi:hypothetical protein
VAELVLRLLDVADLGAALLVCRQWTDLITDLPVWHGTSFTFSPKLAVLMAC